MATIKFLLEISSQNQDITYLHTVSLRFVSSNSIGYILSEYVYIIFVLIRGMCQINKPIREHQKILSIQLFLPELVMHTDSVTTKKHK